MFAMVKWFLFVRCSMNNLIHFFKTMQQIHFNFGIPVQWQDLEKTLGGEVV